jgi:beta-mannosidase
LEQYSARISDIRTDLEVEKDHSSARLRVGFTVEGYQQYTLTAKVAVCLGGTLISSAEADISSEGQASVAFKISKPELWMPNGYGKQTLYDIDVALLAGGLELHNDTRRIGIRSVELVQEPDSHGKSFYFRVNGVDIFCGGSCWIPADSFLTNIKAEKYRAWIELMVPANQKMIR